MKPLSPHRAPDALVTLVYELLDAHLDTIELAAHRPELPWRAHVDYLRALQRAGRAQLAHAAAHPNDARAR